MIVIVTASLQFIKKKKKKKIINIVNLSSYKHQTYDFEQWKCHKGLL